MTYDNIGLDSHYISIKMYALKSNQSQPLIIVLEGTDSNLLKPITIIDQFFYRRIRYRCSLNNSFSYKLYLLLTHHAQ